MDYQMKRLLTIGMLTYDDYDGVWFSLQSIRLNHPEILEKVEFLVIDNNPSSKSGQAIEKFSKWIVGQPIRYVALTGYSSTSLRDLIFRMAQTPYVLCMDCHVLFSPNSLARLIDYMQNHDTGNLLQGPMWMDNLMDAHTHMYPIWRAGMWGIWATDPRWKDENAEPFEIVAHGMGVFACRQDSWVGFTSGMKGFGGEEVCIHEKFRQHGKKTLCLPFLRWLHRFGRPNGTPYKTSWDDRIRNYVLSFRELGIGIQPIIDHFSTILKPEEVERIVREV